MNRAEIKRIMTHFLSDPSTSTFEAAKQYLIPLRRTTMEGYTLTESRCLWFSLLLYKFRKETDVPENIYTAARTYLLDMLSSQGSDDAPGRTYLQVFGQWKKEDHVSFVNEVTGYYLEVLHLKQTIEESKDEATISEWKDSYHGLLYKIRDAATRMGFADQLDARVAEVNRIRHSLVENMMKRAYWDMLEQDITNKQYTTVLCQLLELKELIKEVIPERYHADLHEKFNVDYIQEKLQAEQLDPVYLVQLCRWVMDSMKEWDAAVAQPLYDREIQTWEKAIGTLEWPRFLRFSLELCTLLALDAKTRVSIWRSLIRNPT